MTCGACPGGWTWSLRRSWREEGRLLAWTCLGYGGRLPTTQVHSIVARTERAIAIYVCPGTVASVPHPLLLRHTFFTDPYHCLH